MQTRSEAGVLGGTAGITLIEVLVAMLVGGIIMAGVVNGFIHAIRQADWAGVTFAANCLALQRLEQARAAKWDRWATPPIDTLVSSNFPADVEILDIPISHTNILYGTNFTTITTVSTNPPLRMIRVDCVWRLMSRGLFTNTLITYRAPDQ